nr:hypothetical protein [Rhodococcus sp. CX]
MLIEHHQRDLEMDESPGPVECSKANLAGRGPVCEVVHHSPRDRYVVRMYSGSGLFRQVLPCDPGHRLTTPFDELQAPEIDIREVLAGTQLRLNDPVLENDRSLGCDVSGRGRTDVVGEAAEDHVLTLTEHPAGEMCRAFFPVVSDDRPHCLMLGAGFGPEDLRQSLALVEVGLQPGKGAGLGDGGSTVLLCDSVQIEEVIGTGCLSQGEVEMPGSDRIAIGRGLVDAAAPQLQPV